MCKNTKKFKKVFAHSRCLPYLCALFSKFYYGSYILHNENYVASLRRMRKKREGKWEGLGRIGKDWEGNGWILSAFCVRQSARTDCALRDESGRKMNEGREQG